MSSTMSLPTRKRARAPARLDLCRDRVGLVAGVDEAGRGPLAGPVVAAAVILDPRQRIAGLRDSKQLSALQRERLVDQIRTKALCFSVALASVEEIDRLNILQASLLAMRRAVLALRLRPTIVLVDGNRLPVLELPAEPIVGGDGRIAAIAAASILAKVHRDGLCSELHLRYPGYDFARHKGYATVVHLEALRIHGACPEHRRSFAPVAQVLGLLAVESTPFNRFETLVDTDAGDAASTRNP